MKSLCIFGNGLGMAIAPDVYDLKSTMATVWGGDSLEDSQKRLIVACLPNGVLRPTSEEQLATLQDIVGACEVLLTIRKTGSGHWLSPEGVSFPEAVQRFAFEVARSMHLATHREGLQAGLRCEIPESFSSPLAAHIKSGNVHVATLNYDGLLSALLRADGLLSGHEDFDDLLGSAQYILLDGFKDSKFDRTNLFRKGGKGAWYLHLHGCPLFADREKSRPYLLSEKSLQSGSKSLKNIGKHIVLTHFKHKPNIINSSEILTTYWEFLDLAIAESKRVTLFGYSGNDEHLNRLIAQSRHGRSVRVVEWLGAGTKAVRSKFWEGQLGGEVDLVLLEDVLSFVDW